MKKSKKNMYLFLTGKLISLLGTQMYSFAMGLYILKLTGSAMNFAISILLGTVPRLILGPIGGVISDKTDRKKMVLITDFLSGVVMFIAFGLSLTFGLKLWIVYTSTVLLSSLNTLFSTSFDASMPNLVDDESLNKINSYNQAINSLSGIVGPILGGLIYAFMSPVLFILINGISFLLSTFSETFIDFYWKVEKKVTSISLKGTRFLIDLKDSFLYINKNTNLMIMLQGMLVINFVITAFNIAIPHLLVVQFTISEKAFGVVECMAAVGSLIASVIYARKVYKFNIKQPVIRIIMLAGIVLLCVIPILPFTMATFSKFIVIYYSIMAFSVGSIIVLVNIPLIVYLQELTEDKYRGRVMGLLGTIASAISPLGYLIHGLLLEFVPTYIILIYVGLGLSIISIIMLLRFKSEESDTNISEHSNEISI